MIPNVMKLMGQFSPMLNMFKQGGGMNNPMGMIQQMMGPDKFRQFEGFLQQGKSMSPEEYTKTMFQDSGLDLTEVRRTLGY